MLVSLDYLSGDANGHDGRISIFPDLTGEAIVPEIPSGVKFLLEKPSFAQVVLKDRCYLFIAGGASEALMVTDTFAVLRQFIRPIMLPIREDATPIEGEIGVEQIAGTGPQGLCIFYLRWYDPINRRRSGYSAPSPTLDLSGSESVVWRNVPLRPDPDDDGVSKVEVWVRRNGGAPRRLATRDAGVATFTITESVEYEGEDFEAFSQAPRCVYNAIYNGRLWQAGDINAPERLYYSPPEQYAMFTSSSYLTTRMNEAIVGLVAVRDVLVVLCAKSSYYVTGFSEDDFEMRTLEPFIGGLTHHGVKMVNDIAVVPSQEGPMACTGTSMTPIGSGFSSLWCQYVSYDPSPFVNGFAVNDERSRVYKFFTEGGDGVPSRVWVLDYKPENGGIMAPMFSFDTYPARAKAAAMVSQTGGKVSKLYTAFTDVAAGDAERIVYDDWYSLDSVGSMSVVISPSIVGYDPDGGPNDGITAVEGWILVSYDETQGITSWTLEMMHGPERAMIRDQFSWALTSILGLIEAAAPVDGGGREITPDWASTASGCFNPSALPFKIGLAGEGFGIRLTVVDPYGLVFSGWGFTAEAGKKFLAKYAP